LSIAGPRDGWAGRLDAEHQRRNVSQRSAAASRRPGLQILGSGTVRLEQRPPKKQVTTLAANHTGSIS